MATASPARPPPPKKGLSRLLELVKRRGSDPDLGSGSSEDEAHEARAATASLVHEATGLALRRAGVVLRLESHISQALGYLRVRFMRTGAGEYSARTTFFGQLLERRTFTHEDLDVADSAAPVLLFGAMWVSMAALRRYLDHAFRARRSARAVKMTKLGVKLNGSGSGHGTAARQPTKRRSARRAVISARRSLLYADPHQLPATASSSEDDESVYIDIEECRAEPPAAASPPAPRAKHATKRKQAGTPPPPARAPPPPPPVEPACIPPPPPRAVPVPPVLPPPVPRRDYHDSDFDCDSVTDADVDHMGNNPDPNYDNLSNYDNLLCTGLQMRHPRVVSPPPALVRSYTDPVALGPAAAERISQRRASAPNHPLLALVFPKPPATPPPPPRAARPLRPPAPRSSPLTTAAVQAAACPSPLAHDDKAHRRPTYAPPPPPRRASSDNNNSGIIAAAKKKVEEKEKEEEKEEEEQGKTTAARTAYTQVTIKKKK